MAEIKNEWGTNKIPMHPESFNFIIKSIKDSEGVQMNKISIEEGRKLISKMYASEPPAYEGTTEDRRVPSEEVPEGILVRIYKPGNAPATPKILVYFHGGGNIYGDIELTRTMHRTLSQLCGLIIVDVDYRLCPETKLPGGMDDCAAVTQWVLQNRTAIGGMLESPVGVGGDSAGGQMAIYVTHKVKGLDFQILIYPGTDATGKSPSFEEFSVFVPKELHDWSHKQWFEEGARLDDPRWSPVYHKVDDCVGLPPALIILAQVDAVRDDGRRYAKLLIDAGVFTSVYELKGAYHGFFGLPDSHPELTREAYKQFATFLSGL